MIITGHKLDGVPFLPAGTPRRAMKPELLVIHYTATVGSAAGVIDYFKTDKASAHLVVDTEGKITQMVEFNITAAHAGKSVWNGRPSCNGYSIGIEIVNPGPLFKVDAGFIDTTEKKRPYAGQVVEARHKSGVLPYRYWAVYPEAQLRAVTEAAKAICSTYGITAILGHDDIAPGRKIDPGPAFPMAAFVAEVLG